ncbi:MAG: hypothetical protein WAK55_32650 [Xanthobacteraceae bacterium]
MSTSPIRPIEVKRFQTYDLDEVRSAESLERRRRPMQAKAQQTTKRTFPTRSPLSGI